jgi:pyruvate dehydrogenase E1 component
VKVAEKEQPKLPQREPRLKASNTRERAQDAADQKKWFESLEFVLEYALKNQGPDRVSVLLDNLVDRLRGSGVQVPSVVSTPYVNTIPVEKQPSYPGDWQTEVRIKSYIRWNAMAMVVNANRLHSGLGGHISTFASLATLYEVGYNHFFRGGDGGRQGHDFSRGHATPGTTPGHF